MKILVTGATGLVGCHAVARLLAGGHAVRAFVRDADRLARALAPFGVGAEVEIVRGSIEDEASIERALDGIEGILHAAGRFSPDRRDGAALHALNVEGTRRILEAAARRHAVHPLERIVFVSSILALFPPAGDVMRANGEPASPREMYAATKAAAERVAREWQGRMPVSIVYPAAIQGPLDPTFSVGPRLVADALESGRVLVTQGGLPSSDVRDVAKLILALFDGRAHANRLMAPAFFIEHADYHVLLERLTGRRLEAQRIPAPILRGLGRVGDLASRVGRPVALTSEAAAVLTRSVPVDDAEARALLGEEVETAESSFRDLIRWMVEAGHLSPRAAGRLAEA